MNDMSLMPRVLSKIESGKIVPPLNLEVIVTEHCNIACRQCNHASPIMPKWNASVAKLEKTFGILSGNYRCERLRLIGGEPMLHRDIVEIMDIAKKSGIGNVLQMTTNGMLLDRLPDRGWDILDEIELSFYEISGLSEARIEAIRRKGEDHGTVVNIARYPNFRMTFTSQSAESRALVEDVWRGCKMVNVWSCQALREDRIYRCPQSIYAPGLAGSQDNDEGFELDDGPDMKDRLVAFLNGAGPLGACANCVGSCGKKIPQTALKRADWKADLNRPYADMIDYDLLELSKREHLHADDCRTVHPRLRGTKLLKRRLRDIFGASPRPGA